MHPISPKERALGVVWKARTPRISRGTVVRVIKVKTGERPHFILTDAWIPKYAADLVEDAVLHALREWAAIPLHR